MDDDRSGFHRLGARSMAVDHPILSFEAALVDAQLTGDIAALDRLLDDELYFTGLAGRVFSKADDLAAHRSGQLRITKMNPLERHITALGTTVVVSVLMDAEATVAGLPNAAKLRYTRIWCQRSDGWKVVAGHMSSVEP
jgi:ketosteroid isomerase-like protein